VTWGGSQRWTESGLLDTAIGKGDVGMGVTSPPGLATPYRTQRIPWSTTRGFLRISGSSLGTLVLPCTGTTPQPDPA
jgi:hypothetical protein